MTTTTPIPPESRAPHRHVGVRSRGPLGRLGYWAATHRRRVFAVWAVLIVGLGVFAPKVEHALSGAGWEATGSESVEVRDLIDREFAGLGSSALMVALHSETAGVASPSFPRSRARR